MTSKKEKTKKTSRITLAIFMLYLAVLACLMLYFLSYAKTVLEEYEASQPQYVMERLLATPDFTASMNTAALVFNEFETEEDYRMRVQELLAEQPAEYHFLKENYSDGSLTYGIYAGETPIGTAVLRPENTTTKLIALSITDWDLAELNAYEAYEDYNILISVPDNYTVKINDVTLDSSYITAKTDYPELQYCAEYVTVPQQATYEVTHLKHPAQLVVLNQDLEELPAEDYLSQEASAGSSLAEEASSSKESNPTDRNTYLKDANTVIRLLPAEEEMVDDLKTLVLDAAENYSNFFSRDLPGCQESINPIRHLFPEDSVYLTLAERYRREDMIIFSSHSKTQFLNEQVTEYIPYNESCFSCRVTFDKSMTLGGGREMIDSTDSVYYFVLLDGKWVIADIR